MNYRLAKNPLIVRHAFKPTAYACAILLIAHSAIAPSHAQNAMSQVGQAIQLELAGQPPANPTALPLPNPIGPTQPSNPVTDLPALPSLLSAPPPQPSPIASPQSTPTAQIKVPPPPQMTAPTAPPTVPSSVPSLAPTTPIPKPLLPSFPTATAPDVPVATPTATPPTTPVAQPANSTPLLLGPNTPAPRKLLPEVQSLIDNPQPGTTASLQRMVRLTMQTPETLSSQISRLLPDRYRVTISNGQMVGTFTDQNGRFIATLTAATNSPNVVLEGATPLVNQVNTLVRALDQSDASEIKSIIIRRGANGPGTNGSTQFILPGQKNTIKQVQYIQPVQAEIPINPDTLDAATRKQLRDLGDDVQVEVLPDLDAVILRGRDEDIGELAKIIKRLEEMAAGAQPTIEVYELKHVPGEALAEIIEDIAPDYTGPQQGRVTVTPLSKPNALLIVGWGKAMKATTDLIAKLDKPVPAETQLKVIPLKNAPSAQAATTIQEFFDSRQGLGPKVIVTADPRTNSLIVNAAPRDIEEVLRMIQQLDSNNTGSVDRADVIQLQNSLAADVAQILQQALTNTQSNNANARAAALEFLAADGSAQQLLRSGDLSTIKITASPGNNTLIVTGPPDSVRMIRALIARMDRARDAAQIKVFEIVNGDAGSLVQVLRSLLVSSGGGGGGANAGGTLNLANAAGESSLTPLRFSIEERTNSIIAVGPKGDLEIVEALLARLDAEGSNERINAVYHLKNAPATDVASTINEFLRSERLLEQAGQGAVSATQLIEKEVIVVPETVSNKLVLSASPRYFQQLNDLIQRLDEAPPQVMIQVLIGEVQLSNVEELGIELGVQSSVLFDRSLLENLNFITNTSQQQTADGVVAITEQVIASATNSPGFNFNNFPLGNSGSTQALNNASTVGAQGLGNFGVGRTNNELGFGGLVLSASSESVSVLIRALEESRRLEVLSRPQIRTLDNQPAFIQVGQVVPFIQNSTISQFGQTNSIDFRDVGLIMGVTPRISPDGTVVMEIDAEKSTVGPEDQGIPIASTQDGTIIRAPSIETTRAQTTVSAASGETIVLGGLITKSSSSVERGVPYLSDIPVIGDLFTYTNDEFRRTELLIILTPHVIRNSADNEMLKQTEMARMSWCTADVYDLHGDINYHFTEDALNFNAPAQTIYPTTNPTGAGGTLYPGSAPGSLAPGSLYPGSTPAGSIPAGAVPLGTSTPVGVPQYILQNAATQPSSTVSVR